MKKLILILALSAFANVQTKAQCTPVSNLIGVTNSTNTCIDVAFWQGGPGYVQYFINGKIWADPSGNTAFVTSTNGEHLTGSYVAGNLYTIEVRTHQYNQPNFCNSCDSCSAFTNVIAGSLAPPQPVNVQTHTKHK